MQRLTTGRSEGIGKRGESVNNSGDKSEERWKKLEEIVRQIVREECQRISQNILTVIEKSGAAKAKVEFINGKWVGITPILLDTWRAAYGAVDVEAELSKAAAWLAANPLKTPKSQCARFLNAWLARSQNQASIRSIPTRSEEKKRHCAYCPAVATGMTSGIWSCREHVRDAMEGRPAGHMWGVQAKPVAGDR